MLDEDAVVRNIDFCSAEVLGQGINTESREGVVNCGRAVEGGGRKSTFSNVLMPESRTQVGKKGSMMYSPCTCFQNETFRSCFRKLSYDIISSSPSGFILANIPAGDKSLKYLCSTWCFTSRYHLFRPLSSLNNGALLPSPSSLAQR